MSDEVTLGDGGEWAMSRAEMCAFGGRREGWPDLAGGDTKSKVLVETETVETLVFPVIPDRRELGIESTRHDETKDSLLTGKDVTFCRSYIFPSYGCYFVKPERFFREDALKSTRLQ